MDILSEAAQEHVFTLEKSRPKRHSSHHSASENRKDRRQREMIEKLVAFTTDFIENRNFYFAQQFASPNLQLSSLLDGSNAEYRNALIDLETKYQRSISGIQIYSDYLSARLDREHQLEIEESEKYYLQCRENLKNLLLNHLQNKKKRLRDDKELLDITAVSSLLNLSNISEEASLPSEASLPDRRKRTQRRGQENNDIYSPTIAIEELLNLCGLTDEDKPLADQLLNTLNLAVAKLSEKEKEKERDSRAADKSEREREKAVERGLSRATDSEIAEDLNLILSGSKTMETTDEQNSTNKRRKP